MEEKFTVCLTQSEIDTVKNLIVSKYERFLSKKNRLYVCNLTFDVSDYENRFKIVEETCSFYDNLLKKFLIER